ncbi:MAG: phosphatase PAP2 family protein [Acidimicrobiia bacterium]
MNFVWFSVAGAGVIALVASIVGARHAFIPAWEMRVFRVVNGLPSWLFFVLWLPMQLGNLLVGTAVGLAIAWWAGELDVAIGVITAMLLKLVIERFVRHEMAAHLQVRQRPGTSEPGAVLRGNDVPAAGPSFPSGHIILVAAVACLVAPVLPAWGVWAAFFLTSLVMVGRVYVGAHNPLDVVAGLGAGLVLGGALTAFFG